MVTIEESIKAARKEYLEEPMDKNYNHPIVGLVSGGRVKKIIELLGDLKGKKVLDAGCESGYVAIQAMDKCNPGEICCVDVIDLALYDFEIKIQDRKDYDKFNLLKSPIQDLPYRSNYFDVVICTEVLEHAPGLRGIIKEFHRVLKPGGKLIITIPNEKLRQKIYPIVKLLGINTDVEDEVTLFHYSDEIMLGHIMEHFTVEKHFNYFKLFPLTRFYVAIKDTEE